MPVTDDIIQKSHDYLMPTYPLQGIVLERGEGCYLYDTEGKKYLDVAAGIAVCSLGHAHPGYIETATAQMGKFIMCPGSYPTGPRAACAEYLVTHSAFDQVFFSNSGAEAIEGALKLARKWAHEHKGEDCKEFICFRNSFHGRTFGAVSITEKSKHQPWFAPYLPGAHFADLNDIDSVKELLSDKICALVVEPVQGESGIRPADPAFLQALRDLCDEHNILLVFDEIQCGIGRLGTLFAYQHFGVTPDILCLAKGLGNGYPVGALMAGQDLAACFGGGVHGTTYGGNPLATRLALFVLQQINRPAFLENVIETGASLRAGLQKLQQKTGRIEEVRGIGLMIGVDINGDFAALMKELLAAGLMATKAGEKTLRLTPPLIAGPDEVKLCLEILEQVLVKGDA